MQEQAFDDLGMPYEWTDDLGAIVATAREGVGDGMWVFQKSEVDGGLVVIASEDPSRGERMRAARHDRLVAARRAIAAWTKAWNEKRAARDAEVGEGNEDDEDDKNNEDDEDNEESKDERGRGEERGKEIGKEERRKEKKIVAKAKTRRNRHADDELFAQCTVDKRVRSDGVHSDVTITTPDGQKFRSKVAALRHMKA